MQGRDAGLIIGIVVIGLLLLGPQVPCMAHHMTTKTTPTSSQ